MSIELASVSDDIADAIQAPPPEMGKAAPTQVELLRGVVDPTSGEWPTTATVREMNGADEEELARLSATQEDISYAEYTTALLTRAVTSIGSLPTKSDPSILDNLIIGDRDMLFLGIIKATYGNVRTFNVSCPSCHSANDVRVNMDEDFPVTQPLNDPRVPRTVTLRNGMDVKVKFPTGADAKLIASSGSTSAEQSTTIITRCVVWDDDRSDAVKTMWAKELSVADRKSIVTAALEDQPGPRLEEVEASCASCSETITMIMDWASLLFG